MIKLLLTILLLTACQKPKVEPKEPEPIDLPEKVALYESDILSRIDNFGCDGLLFAGLLGAVGIDVDIRNYQSERVPGLWYRSPGHDCYRTGRSKSTISRDMLLGLLWYAWYNEDLDIMMDLYNYGKSHNWQMGKGVISRIFMTGLMQQTLALGIEKLGGERYPEAEYNQDVDWFLQKGNTGYRAHLTVLHILLRGKIEGEITGVAFERLEEQFKRVPANGLFCYAYGLYAPDNHDPVSYDLVNNEYFPDDRLPRSEDRCEPWLWQRDPGDWEPCSEGLEHTGGDLVFLAHLMGE